MLFFKKLVRALASCGGGWQRPTVFRLNPSCERSTPMEILHVEAHQIPKAAQVVADAFHHYPMMAHYFPNPDRRRRRLPWYMEKTLRCALRYGEVLATADFSGILFTLPPGHTRLSQGEYVRNGFLWTPLVMGLQNYLKSDACEQFVADTHEKLMAGRSHIYLWGLVADPKAQRKGAGTALMHSLTARADAEALPVYLETHDEKNVAYYQRFGFELIHQDVIPNHGLDIWCMAREAAPANI